MRGVDLMDNSLVEVLTEGLTPSCCLVHRVKSFFRLNPPMAEGNIKEKEKSKTTRKTNQRATPWCQGSPSLPILEEHPASFGHLARKLGERVCVGGGPFAVGLQVVLLCLC